MVFRKAFCTVLLLVAGGIYAQAQTGADFGKNARKARTMGEMRAPEVNQWQQREVIITGNNELRLLTMDGGTLTLQGNGCSININGYVKQIDITGDGNTITADKLGGVYFTGDNNVIKYRTPVGATGRPWVHTRAGEKNRVYELK